MSKVKVVKKTAEGKVFVSMGLKLSANFQTGDMNIGMEQQVLPGETTEQAMQRVFDQVQSFFIGKREPVMEELHGFAREKSNSLKKNKDYSDR